MKVQVKNIPVRYDGKTHQPGEQFEMEKKHFNEDIVEEVEVDEGNLEELDIDELKKVNKADIAARLDELEIEYKSTDNKDVLVSKLVGDEETGEQEPGQEEQEEQEEQEDTKEE